MFNSISWTDFLLTVGCLAGAYYFIASLLFYRHEIIARLKGARQTAAPFAPPLTNSDTDNLLGPIKRPGPANEPGHFDDDEQIKEDEHIQFGEQANADSSTSANPVIQSEHDAENALVLGRISDLLEEVKLILSLFGDEKPSKEDLASTLRALLEKYQGLAASRYLASINIFLYDLCKDTCAQELRPEDVSAWWPNHSIQ